MRTVEAGLLTRARDVETGLILVGIGVLVSLPRGEMAAATGPARTQGTVMLVETGVPANWYSDGTMAGIAPGPT